MIKDGPCSADKGVLWSLLSIHTHRQHCSPRHCVLGEGAGTSQGGPARCFFLQEMGIPLLCPWETAPHLGPCKGVQNGRCDSSVAPRVHLPHVTPRQHFPRLPWACPSRQVRWER